MKRGSGGSKKVATTTPNNLPTIDLVDKQAKSATKQRGLTKHLHTPVPSPHEVSLPSHPPYNYPTTTWGGASYNMKPTELVESWPVKAKEA